MDDREAVTRWGAFLDKIRASAESTLKEAEQGCGELFASSSLDPLPMSNAWNAVEIGLRDLGRQIDDVWRERVEPALDGAGWARPRIEAERRRGTELQRGMDRDRERAAVRVFAEAARAIVARARQDLACSFPCRNCGAPAGGGGTTFRSYYVTCAHCRSVNTVVPSVAAQRVESFGCHQLAREVALELWFAWEDAHERMRAASGDRGAARAAEAALRAYNEAYLRARIAIVPELEADFARDLAGRMAFFYEELERS